MALGLAYRRAYLEARHQYVHGAPSGNRGHVNREGLEVWLMAFDIAEHEDISPWDALLVAVRRRAARVRAVDRIINAAWDDHRRLCEADPNHGNPEVPNDDVRVWMAESRNEERLLTRAAKMAVDAGVADALVRRLELEGQLAVDALMAGLDALNLPHDQRMTALAAMHRQLMQLPSGAVDMHNSIPGIVVSDNPSDEDRPQ